VLDMEEPYKVIIFCQLVSPDDTPDAEPTVGSAEGDGVDQRRQASEPAPWLRRTRRTG
jgi:hypothetical protein